MESETIDEYKDQMVDEDALVGTDIKINPDFYIHLALISCQKALGGDDPEKNMLKYWQSVAQLEALMRAAKRLPEDYDNLITDFKNKEEYKTSSENRKQFMLNQKKYEVCVQMAFENKNIDTPMTF